MICITSYHPLEKVTERSLRGTDQKEAWEENGLISLWEEQGRWSSQRGEFGDKFDTVKEERKETEAFILEAERILSSFYSTFQ